MLEKYISQGLPRKVLLYIMVFTLVVFTALFVMRDFQAVMGDGIGYYAYNASFFIDGDFDFYNQYTEFNPRNYSTPDYSTRTATGLVPNYYPIGFAILTLPFFLAGHVITLMLNFIGINLKADGFSFFYQYLTAAGILFYGYWGFVFSVRFLRSFISEKYAVWGVVIYFFTSNQIYYYFNPAGYSHVLSFAMVSIFMYVWYTMSQNPSLKRYIILAVTGGLMILVRLQNGMFLIFPLFTFFEMALKHRRKSRVLLKYFCYNTAFLVTLFIVVFPQFAMTKILYGSYFIDSYFGSEEGFIYLANPKILQVLFSPKSGLLLYHPVYLAGFTGLFFLKKFQTKVFYLFLFCVLGQLYVNSAWSSWDFGYSFGVRTFQNVGVIIALGIAFLFKRIDSIPVKMYSLAVLTAINLVLMGLFFIHVI